MDKGLESSGNAVILKKVSKLTENEPNQDEVRIAGLCLIPLD